MKGSIEEVRPGVWTARVDLPRGEDGQRKQKRVTIYAKGRRDADNQLAKIIAEANAGDLAGVTKETVESYLAGWLKKREVTDPIAPKTADTWSGFLRAYIAPRIGKVVLEKLTRRHVEELYHALRTSGRTRSQGGLSARSVLHVHRFLSEALKAAVHVGLLPRNPCEGMGPRNVTLAERERVTEYDGETLAQLYAVAAPTWLYLPVVLATGVGLRRGEVLGLKWSAIDFAAGTISVEQAAVQLPGEGVRYTRPKTKKSARTVTLPAFVLDALRQHRGAQLLHAAQIEEAWSDQGFVITDGEGSPRTPYALTRGFALFIRKAGLPPITYHDCRHINASLLLAAGVDTKVVSNRLGHCNTNITANLYQHVLPRLDQQAAETTDAIFRHALGR